MDITEAMIAIIEEAERQGFTVNQYADGALRFHKVLDDGTKWDGLLSYPRTAGELLRILQLLIVRGLDWTRW